MRNERQPAIDWEAIDQKLFDRIVEALVNRLYDQSWLVEPIDGRGGDGGIDIDCTQEGTGRRHIFQLKYFPEGFSGMYNGRRQQIKRSYDALKQVPDKWILVAPCLSDKSGYTYLRNLVVTSGRMEFWHRARLDDLLAQHPDLINHFSREDYALDQAIKMGLEQSVLAGGLPDLNDRIVSLGQTVDSVDANWTVDFSRRGETIFHTLRAKHPRAHKVSPISVSLSIDETTLSNQQKTALRNMHYGLADTVTLPEQALRRIDIAGPELVQRNATAGVEVVWSKEPNQHIAGRPVELHTTNDDSSLDGVFHGTIIDGSAGMAGMSLRVEFAGILILTLLMPHTQVNQDNSLPVGSLTLDEEYPRDASVSDARLATEIMVNFGHGRRAELHIEDRHIATFQLEAGALDTTAYEEQLALIEDLEVVQQAAKNRFPMPHEITDKDRVWLRALRLALEHGRTQAPGATGIHGIVQAGALNAPHSQAMLDGEPRGVIQHLTPFRHSVCGRTLTFPHMALYHPAMRLKHPERIRRELESGHETRFTLETVDGSLMTLIGPNYPESGAPPEPWDLPGVEEPQPWRGQDGAGPIK